MGAVIDQKAWEGHKAIEDARRSSETEILVGGGAAADC